MRSLKLVLLGALSAAALPPLNLFFLLWICLPLLLADIDRRQSAKGAFLSGWLWGLGHFAAGLYWISYSLLVDAARFGWMIPFALGGLGAVLGIYLGAVAAFSRLVAPGWPRLLLFAAAWGGAEWLRGVVLTGFPWNPIGSVWSDQIFLLQIVSVIGSFGLGVVTIACAGAPALFLQSRQQGAVASAAGLLVLAAIAGWGAGRVPDGAMPVQPGITLRLVQANIPQTLKWRPEMRAEHLAKYLALSRAPSATPPTHIIWPETAAPSFLEQDWQARQAVAAAAPEGGLMLVGTLRGLVENREVTQVWNSLEAVDGAGTVVGTYDKAHLVPFGEYVPRWIPVQKLTAISLPISAGPGPKTLTLPGLPPVGPIICYEAIFPDAVIDRKDRPDWILNVTNDGWFGVSSGPYQHLAAARMRAIEEGLPLVRAAYTGISAVVDPFGRVIGSIGLDREGVLDAPLPQPLVETPYARRGGLIFSIMLLLTACLAFYVNAKRSHRL